VKIQINIKWDKSDVICETVCVNCSHAMQCNANAKHW